MPVTESLPPDQKPWNLAPWALPVGLAVVLLVGPAREIGAQRAARSRPDPSVQPASIQRVVFVRPRKWLEQDGDLWMVSAAGKSERRLTMSLNCAVRRKAISSPWLWTA
jgi:hypothetical protein